jgi:hypothetical protein
VQTQVTRIERFASRADAELARSVLEANGIPAYVSGDDAGGLHPEIPYGIGGTAVVVPEERYADAIALLDDEFGDEPGDEAELEAAAMAAGPAEGGHPGGTPYPVGREVMGSDEVPATTRRSGDRRRLFVVVLVLMLVIVLVGVLVDGGVIFWRPS